MRMRYNFGVQGSGFRGSPEGVLPLDGGMKSLLELGMKDLSVAEI